MKRFSCFFLFIFSFLIIDCSRVETLYLPVINHTDLDFYLTVKVNDKIVMKDFEIKKLSIYEKIKINIKDNCYIVFTIKEKNDNNIISEETLWFPDGGIVSNSSRGGFFVEMDIVLTENGKVKFLYSEDSFKYGFPKETVVSTN